MIFNKLLYMLILTQISGWTLSQITCPVGYINVKNNAALSFHCLNTAKINCATSLPLVGCLTCITDYDFKEKYTYTFTDASSNSVTTTINICTNFWRQNLSVLTIICIGLLFIIICIIVKCCSSAKHPVIESGNYYNPTTRTHV